MHYKKVIKVVLFMAVHVVRHKKVLFPMLGMFLMARNTVMLLEHLHLFVVEAIMIQIQFIKCIYNFVIFLQS